MPTSDPPIVWLPPNSEQFDLAAPGDTGVRADDGQAPADHGAVPVGFGPVPGGFGPVPGRYGAVPAPNRRFGELRRFGLIAVAVLAVVGAIVAVGVLGGTRTSNGAPVAGAGLSQQGFSFTGPGQLGPSIQVSPDPQLPPGTVLVPPGGTAPRPGGTIVEGICAGPTASDTVSAYLMMATPGFSFDLPSQGGIQQPPTTVQMADSCVWHNSVSATTTNRVGSLNADLGLLFAFQDQQSGPPYELTATDGTHVRIDVTREADGMYYVTSVQIS
jgi:hypothetical protein